MTGNTPRNRRRALWVWLALALALAGAAAYRAQAPIAQGPAPAVRFQLLDGTRPALADWRGQAVLVSFWSTSCPVCLQEVPELNRLHREYRERGLRQVAVALRHDPPDEVLDVVRRMDLAYPVALDLQGRVQRAFPAVAATPTHFLVGPDGTLLERRVGRLDTARLEARLEGLLPASPGDA